MDIKNEYWEYDIKTGFVKLENDPVWDYSKFDDMGKAFEAAGYSSEPMYKVMNENDDCLQITVFYAEKNKCEYKYIVEVDIPDINYFYIKNVPSFIFIINKFLPVINSLKTLEE